MDLDNKQENTMDKSTSITNNENVENITVTKNLVLETLQPPNGDREESLESPIDDEEIQEVPPQAPANNVNSDSHLESNINVIENQNNENLERDSELMEPSIESESIPPEIISESTNTDIGSKNIFIESSVSELSPKHTINENSSDIFAQNEQSIAEHPVNSANSPSVDDDNSNAQEDTESNISENYAPESSFNIIRFEDSENEKPQAIEIMDIDASGNSIVPSTVNETDKENLNLSVEKIWKDTEIEAADNLTLGYDKVQDLDSQCESSEQIDDFSMQNIDQSKNQKETDNLELQIQPSSVEKNDEDEIRNSEPEFVSDKIIPSDISDEINALSSNNSGNEELCETDPQSNSEITSHSMNDESYENDPQSPGAINESNENDTQQSNIADQNEEPCENDQYTTGTTDQSRETDPQPSIVTIHEESCEIIDSQSTTGNEDNDAQSSIGATEFEQVNLDGSEHESDKNIESGSDLNTEPLATDILHSSQGADEAITILPDSEREITEAEKEAASSLPTLKDIAEKTKTPDVTSEEIDAAEEDEIKMYKYDKQDQLDCCQCKEKKPPKYHFSNKDQEVTYICDDTCLTLFKDATKKKIIMLPDEGTGLRVKNFIEGPARELPPLVFIRKCASCGKETDDIETNLNWEIMDFCNEFCLSKYQKMIGSKCASCQGDVKSTSLGKYCVRFGNDIRQFCSSTCLEQYKKGLKVCSYCQQDMSNGPDGFLAPVGEKGQFKDFCSKICMEKYDIMTNDRPPNVEPGTMCSVCKAENISIEFDHNNSSNYFCGEPCFVAFAFVNKISPEKCAMCGRHFNKSILEQHTMYYDNVQYSFCSNSCENIYIIANRKIVPCSWCKVKKYNFDMIKKYSKTEPVINMCSINCLNMYQVSLSAVNPKPSPCNFCKKQASPAYHLTMSDASIRNFCSYGCVMNFQNQYPKQLILKNLKDPVPTGAPQKSKKVTTSDNTSDNITQLPVITNVQSLANRNGSITPPLLPPSLSPITSTRLTRSKISTPSPTASQTVQNIDLPVQVQVKQHYITKETAYPDQRNVAVMCQPRKAIKSIQTTPVMKDASVQTQMNDINKILLPVPVPIYVPTPCHMYSTPVPFPVPFPLPIPIPIFIPTTRNSAAGIMKEIKKIQVKIPTDPYEAELLMMAEMVAGEKKKEDNTDSESDIDESTGDAGDYSPEPVDTNNTFGDDMLQMALKMATELDEPAVDLEGALTANTITAPQGAHPTDAHPQEENVDDPQPIHHPHLIEKTPLRGRKRGMRGSPRGTQPKRGRRMSHQQGDMPMMQPVQPPPPPEPQEKPDANMCLKYTFGVNAWKQWVTTKNAELEKSTRRVKLFKTEILQLTADELNYSLCLFVKEVRKPNGQEYAPDTIYYLCLGIQQYLFENGRIDNIFCDPYYEKFTDCLDEVAKKFSVLYNDSHYIVTRVEEEHLWESKQLGAHSPHVLLSTLMFFNTKHFNLTTVDEHMQLSFSHIMKHWKRNPNQPGASKVPGSRNVLLRFYPPQSALQNNQRKKKVYEQQENEENPLRCPVKLYEFYLSKCPESVKTRNDVFYLQPERSCVPDSPVWYSTMPLPKEALEKMLHRVKMVKEINVALLTS